MKGTRQYRLFGISLCGNCVMRKKQKKKSQKNPETETTRVVNSTSGFLLPLVAVWTQCCHTFLSEGAG